MKKLLTLIACAGLTLALTGCKEKTASEEAADSLDAAATNLEKSADSILKDASKSIEKATE